jgi:hypothetical protein
LLKHALVRSAEWLLGVEQGADKALAGSTDGRESLRLCPQPIKPRALENDETMEKDGS